MTETGSGVPRAPSDEDRLRQARPGSGAWYDRARQAIGGGLGHDVRHAVPFPTYVARAQGAYKWDVDGHRYIDYHVGNGALLIGHAHPAIVEAVIKAAPLGTHFGNDHPLQVEWAERIRSLVPCAERVRFTNSGTESAMLACRVARAHTGRSVILRLEGHFHGWGDELVTGFRWAPGGAQERFGVTPDLSTHAKIIGGGVPGAAICGLAEVMSVFDITGDPFHDRFRRVAHQGTYNATPITAAAGLACLALVATGEPTRRADAMAERLRLGMTGVLDRRGVAGLVYGESSVFHVYLEPRGATTPIRRREDYLGLGPVALKSMAPALVQALQNGFRLRGVELLSYNGGMTSAAHEEADVDATVEAFDDLIGELLARDALRRA